MAQRAGGHAVDGVVLAVRRGDDDHLRRGAGEDGSLKRRQPLGVHVLDDLHEHRRV
jgi:hypothetical protein